MNTKKHKSKHREKPSKVVLEAHVDVESENLNSRQGDSERKKDISDKEEQVELPKTNSEMKESAIESLDCDVPKKPKRKKTKKKSSQDKVSDELDKLLIENEIENTKNQNINKITTSDASKQKDNIEKSESCMNTKKNIGTSDKNVEEGTTESSDKNIEEQKENKVAGTEAKEIPVSRKKKKKKSHHSSDKPDVNVECTSGFQKILEARNIEKKEAVNISLQDNIIVETNQAHEILTVTEEKSRIKKKQKKNKNGSMDVQTCFDVDNKLMGPNISTSTYTVDESNNKSEVKEENDTTEEPKTKAEIAKPVQRKLKVKSDFDDVQDKEISDQSNSDKTVIQNTEGSGKRLNEYKEHVQELNFDIKPSQIGDHAKNQKNIVECVNAETIQPKVLNVDIITDKNVVGEYAGQEQDNSGFVAIKTGKKKNKRQQNTDQIHKVEETSIPEITDSKNKNLSHSEEEKRELSYNCPHIDIDGNIKTENIDSTIITPDLIQYPRSTSQLHTDENNNTQIQEISPADVMKLSIPTCVNMPIIEGSGETPDVQYTKEPIIVKNTERSPKFNKTGATYIKSKMFEVNKEMEELKQSIERSIVELTGSEKCDSNVDAVFEELFQCRKEENPDIKEADTFNTRNTTEPSILFMNPNMTLETAGIPTSIDELTQDKHSNLKNETEKSDIHVAAPVYPARLKSKDKSKRKGKKDPLDTNTSNTSRTQQNSNTSGTQQTSTTSQSNNNVEKKSDKPEKKSEQDASKEKGKQQRSDLKQCEESSTNLTLDLSFTPIENFEDALTSSVDDVNKTFEIIASEATQAKESVVYENNPQINIIAPTDDGEKKSEYSKTQKPISQPKNLLGQRNIPVSLNKNDYKKEKSRPPSSIQAKVKIKDANCIEKDRETRELLKEANGDGALSYITKENENMIYKYSFRIVYLQNACHVCRKDLNKRVPCNFCSLVFYCSQKHKDDDWPNHQPLCFAVSTIAHLKEQKFIYADAQNIVGQDYRILRMQMILSCEKILKRKLVPWEQEALLYPRICGDVGCREWKQSKLKDCETCGQISFCADRPDHLPSAHRQWCKSYALYHKLVHYQQTKGRLEPRLPTKVLTQYRIPENLNQILGSMYEKKIDMDDINYAALTQIATAPLTTAFSFQLYNNKICATSANGLTKKSTFTIHCITTDAQFEIDFLNKWEIFFLHLIDIQNLRIVLVGQQLNPSNLPLDIIGKIRLCETCKINQRRVIFDFYDNQSYADYYSGIDFITPDIVCAFNANIQRSPTFKKEDTWPMVLKCIFKQQVPFLLTSYTMYQLKRNIDSIKDSLDIDFKIVSDPKQNPFSSVRPDRNFITDHEMPLLFKNYCFSILCGAQFVIM